MALILLGRIQEGLSIPSPESSTLLDANTNDNQQVNLLFIFSSKWIKTKTYTFA